MAIELIVNEQAPIEVEVESTESTVLNVAEGRPIYPNTYRGETTVTPTEEEQTLSTHNLMLQSDITVEAIPDDYIGTGVVHMDSSDLIAEDDTVTVPSGYYPDGASKAVESGSISVPDSTITANPSISVDESGAITATVSASQTVSPAVQSGYVTTGNSGIISVSGSNTVGLPTQGASIITPSESEQIAVPKGKFTTENVMVGAIPDTYLIPSGSLTITENDTYNVGPLAEVVVNVEGSALPVLEEVSKTYTPTEETQTDTLTPSDGYDGIGEADITINPIPEQYIIPSGTKSISENGEGIDVTEYASVDVDVNPSLQTKSATYTPTTSQQTDSITADEAYYGLGEVDVTINAMPSGDPGTPTIERAKDSTNLTASVTFPDITGGYIDTIAQVDVPFTLETKTLTPSASGQDATPTSTSHYLNNVHVNPIPQGYVVPSGSLTITENGTDYNVQNYSRVTVNVPSGVSGGLVHVGSLNDYRISLYDTDYNGWTPSTTAKVILATASLGTFTATDIVNNDYFIRQRAYIDVVYESGTTNGKGLYKKDCVENWYAVTRRPSNNTNMNSGTRNTGVAENVTNLYVGQYYNSGWVTLYSSAYGIYPSNQAPTFSSATAASPTITVNRMVWNAKCHATYFSTAYANKVDQANTFINIKTDIYRREGGYDRATLYTSIIDMWNNGLVVNIPEEGE